MMNKYQMCTAEELASQFNMVLSLDNKNLLSTKEEHNMRKAIEARKLAEKKKKESLRFRMPNTTEISPPRNPEVKKKEEKRA